MGATENVLPGRAHGALLQLKQGTDRDNSPGRHFKYYRFW